MAQLINGIHLMLENDAVREIMILMANHQYNIEGKMNYTRDQLIERIHRDTHREINRNVISQWLDKKNLSDDDSTHDVDYFANVREYYFKVGTIPTDTIITEDDLETLLTNNFYDPHVTSIANWLVANDWTMQHDVNNNDAYEFGEIIMTNPPTDHLITSDEMDNLFELYSAGLTAN